MTIKWSEECLMDRNYPVVVLIGKLDGRLGWGYYYPKRPFAQRLKEARIRDIEAWLTSTGATNIEYVGCSDPIALIGNIPLFYVTPGAILYSDGI